MKPSKTAEQSSSETEVYKHFMRLSRDHRREIAMRILRNQRVMADLYDHFLIQRSLDEPGQSLAWESYSRSRRAER